VLLAGFVEAVARARRSALPAPERDVRHVDRHLLVDDAALHDLALRLGVPLHHVHAVDDPRVVAPDDSGDRAAPADVLARQHDDVVTLLHLHRHNTSGASDTMRMKRRSRSSRPTGPKMRVPRGCIWSLINTAAFSSKRM